MKQTSASVVLVMLRDIWCLRFCFSLEYVYVKVYYIWIVSELIKLVGAGAWSFLQGGSFLPGGLYENIKFNGEVLIDLNKWKVEIAKVFIRNLS